MQTSTDVEDFLRFRSPNSSHTVDNKRGDDRSSPAFSFFWLTSAPPARDALHR